MNSIKAALADLDLQDIPNYSATAKKYEVNRTTLSRRHRGITAAKGVLPHNNQLLSTEQLNTLVKYINELTDRGLPPTNAMVRTFARDICGKWPGKNWVYEFVKSKKNNLNSGFLTGADMDRKKADNIYQYQLYFDLVCKLYIYQNHTNIIQIKRKFEEYRIKPCDVYNMDEKGFLIGVLQKTRRVFDKEHLSRGKLLGAGQDGNREWITLIGSICMDGTYLPPSIIYQADSGNLQDTWLDGFDPKEHNCFFTSSHTGWTNEELGYSWLVKVFDRATKEKAHNGRNRRLLFVDGHNSHVNMKFLDWCDRNRVLVAVYPPHSTHRLQPLDVSLFSPLANFYSQNVSDWMHKTQGLSGLSKRDFFDLFWPAFVKAFTPKNILSGWERTGLQPLNPARVLDQIRPALRPPSSGSTSGSSALADADWRKVRRLVKDAVGEALAPQGRKIINTIDRLTTENIILKAKNTDLRETLRLEKDKRRRGKPLFDDLGVDGETKAMFFSPSKIQRARDRQLEKEQEKDLVQAQKAEDKHQKQLAKEEQQLLTAQRKAGREEMRLQRQKEKAQKQAEQAKAKEDRMIEQQLKSNVIEAKKLLKKVRQSSKSQQRVENKVIEVSEEEEGQIRASRFGRQLKASKQFDL
jgi:hypothetical protein